MIFSGWLIIFICFLFDIFMVCGQLYIYSFCICEILYLKYFERVIEFVLCIFFVGFDVFGEVGNVLRQIFGFFFGSLQ